MGERHRDEYNKAANRLVQRLYVELVRSGDTTGLNLAPSTTTGSASSTSNDAADRA